MGKEKKFEVFETKKKHPQHYIGTPKEIVLQMSRDDFIVHGKWDYMKEVKERLELMYDLKIKIRKGAFKSFLDELVRVRFVSMKEVA